MVEEGRRRFDRRDDRQSRIDPDTVMRLLSDPLCRYILLELAASPGNTSSVDGLIDRYLERTEEVDRESIEVQCHHAHLPALESAGVVDLDEESGAIRYLPDPFVDDLLALLERWNA